MSFPRLFFRQCDPCIFLSSTRLWWTSNLDLQGPSQYSCALVIQPPALLEGFFSLITSRAFSRFAGSFTVQLCPGYPAPRPLGRLLLSDHLQGFLQVCRVLHSTAVPWLSSPPPSWKASSL